MDSTFATFFMKNTGALCFVIIPAEMAGVMTEAQGIFQVGGLTAINHNLRRKQNGKKK
ncbi:hypothetical protein SAMN05216238_11565 [Lentibacillus persicus]|uniref:Uncharacterized protein n=1 Tax=Lentibacillus persicus TaxID=640948 RepID=A0A1I2AGA7_9BACI|nr:hypothetical protein SAMN05216238_11565 [Lentibacillus persicus]